MKSNTEMSKQIYFEKLKSRMLDALSGKGFNNAATCGEVLELLDHIAALEKENVSLEQDAARYQWLCDGNGYFMEENFLCGHENEKQAADKAIDTAMEASNAKADL